MKGQRDPGWMPEFSRRTQLVVVGASITGLWAVALFAVTSSPPMRMQITGVRTTGSLSTIQAISVYATDTSSRVIRPSFTVAQNGGAITTFWQKVDGPATLRPGQSARYLLAASNLSSQVPVTGYFSVVAYTQNPDTVSISNTFLPRGDHVIVTPASIDTPVPTGQAVVVHATLRDIYDRPVHRPGVPIYLGQIIYDQSGIENSSAEVNGDPPGTSPVKALTNQDGIATFSIIGTQGMSDPVYFQANLRNGPDGYPYGYSTILSILFSQNKD